MHQKQSSQDIIGFSYEKSAGHQYRQFSFWKNPVEKCTGLHDLFRGATSTEEK
jgi:hypothetical protein